MVTPKDFTYKVKSCALCRLVALSGPPQDRREERELISRTVAGNRAYTLYNIINSNTRKRCQRISLHSDTKGFASRTQT